MFIIIGNEYQFIFHCLSPQDPWQFYYHVIIAPLLKILKFYYPFLFTAINMFVKLEEMEIKYVDIMTGEN